MYTGLLALQQQNLPLGGFAGLYKMGRIVRADVGKGKRLSNTFQEGAGFDQFTVVHPTIYFCAPCYDFNKAERFNFILRDQFAK